MKKRLLLSISLLLTYLSGFCTVWKVIDTGLSFSPANLTIQFGDTVNFVLASSHNVEADAFRTPFGGGMVFPTQLGVGVHRFFCSPHVHAGMEGTITVEEAPTAIFNSESSMAFSIYPNPSNGSFKFMFNNSEIVENCRMEIYSIRGELIFSSAITSSQLIINLNSLAKGMHIIKIYDRSSVQRKEIVIQ